MCNVRNAIRAAVAAFLLLGWAAAAEPDRLAPHLRVAGVTLEATSLAGAGRTLGEAEVRHNGEDGFGSALAACYAGEDGTTLVLLSHVALGGVTVTAYELVADGALATFSGEGQLPAPGGVRPRCARSSGVSRRTPTSGGLRLGMTEREVVARLGRPAEARCGVLVFRSEDDVSRPDDRSAGVAPDHEDDRVLHRVRTLRVAFSGGRASAVHAEEIATVAGGRLAPARGARAPTAWAAAVAP